MDKELYCKICSNVYSDAVILPCNDCACANCLISTLDINVNQTNDRVINHYSKNGLSETITRECPICNQTILLPPNGVLGLPRFKIIDPLLESIREKTTSKMCCCYYYCCLFCFCCFCCFVFAFILLRIWPIFTKFSVFCIWGTFHAMPCRRQPMPSYTILVRRIPSISTHSNPCLSMQSYVNRCSMLFYFTPCHPMSSHVIPCHPRSLAALIHYLHLSFHNLIFFTYS